jgi:hypothetical protein
MLEHHLSIDNAREYILYACPLGELAQQLDRYFVASRAAVGTNAAHQYMPHCTLASFFHDAPDAVGIYTAAVDAALRRARPARPQAALTILEMRLGEDFHGLLLDGPWLKALVADVVRNAHSPTRRDALRPKDWLHLSLAYAFPPQQHAPLAQLARSLVDISAPVEWELRFYERHVDGAWQAHARWPL